jgi:enterochelin esterase-like enzyme
VFATPGDTGPSAGHLPLEPHSLPAAGTTPTPWIDENGIVTFETGTQYATATNITVWANWGPAGNWLRIPMVKQADDRWRLTLGPLEGGSYYYKFIVDRVDKKDTGNPTTTISEVNWSTFHVPGPGVRGEFTADVAPEHRGTVTVMNFTSSATGNPTRQANVWTPPGYDPDRAQPYPVFYLQHGGGQTWSDWVDVGRAAQILDNHLLQGTIEPMVVVMANGNGVNFQNELYQRLIPAVEAQFNTSSQPGERAIAGLSMGSGLAMTALYQTPGQFAYVGAFSAFSNPPASADVQAINDGTRLLRIYSGDIQDFTYQATLTMVSQLTSRGINHEFAPLIPGPHSWDVWQKALIDLLPRLFTNHRPVFPAGGETQAVDEGQNLVFTVDATDPDGDALTVTADGLPDGATFDAATQQLSWTPDYTQAGVYEVTFTASEGTLPHSLTETKTVTITVRNVTVAEQISGLKDAVAALPLGGGLKNALTVKLNQVTKLLAKGKTAAAVDVLSDDFIGQVNSLLAQGKLTAEQAAALIDAAEAVIENITS